MLSVVRQDGSFTIIRSLKYDTNNCNIVNQPIGSLGLKEIESLNVIFSNILSDAHSNMAECGSIRYTKLKDVWTEKT